MAKPPAAGHTHPPKTDHPGHHLAIGALGVVFGDIGTSPLYALRECFLGPRAAPLTSSNILGVVSLIFWSLLIVISLKYAMFVMRADNHGEGGILALTALLDQGGRRGYGRRSIWLAMGVFGAALLYGDGLITPAISVLSAVEGLIEVTPAFAPYVNVIAVVILMALFVVQRKGAATLGVLFGRVTLIWFLVLSVSGLASIVSRPEIIGALDPRHAFGFFATNGFHSMFVLGGVFLVVTGGEALYADMGQFGRRPIVRMWFAIVLPALVLNYFGQGALLLTDPASVTNPFYLLFPGWAHLPMVGLATLTTVIASQAVISAAFSLTGQAVNLGYLPRLRVVYTSAEVRGQVYVPAVNWVLMLGTVALVLGFGSSSALAGAYGVAVATTMAITTILAVLIAYERWGWPVPVLVLVASPFAIVDLAFLTANALKIGNGGWVPLLLATAVYVGMSTWKVGRTALGEKLRNEAMTIELFLSRIQREAPARVPGTAVYLVKSSDSIPPALLHNLEHNHALHERIVLLTFVTQQTPRVPASERVTVEDLQPWLRRVIARYGFQEYPNALEVLGGAGARGLDVNVATATFFVGRESYTLDSPARLPRWRARLFIVMARNAHLATDFFRLPRDRVVELGVQNAI